MLKRYVRRRRGFGLIELAVVLGVAGILTGAVWSAAANAWQNYKASTAVQQIMTVVENMRVNFTALTSLPGEAPDVFVVKFMTNKAECTASTCASKSAEELGIMPVEMQRNPSLDPGNSPIDHALARNGASFIAGGGSFTVLLSSFLGAAPILSTMLQDLSQGDCIKLLMELPITDASVNIKGINVINTSAINACAIVNGNAVYNPASCTVMSGVTPMTLNLAKT